jgi:electron transfer flavoprotein alpha subunit
MNIVGFGTPVRAEKRAVSEATLELSTKARQLGEPSAASVGPGVDAAERLAESGVGRTYVADAEELGRFLVTPSAVREERAA